MKSLGGTFVYPSDKICLNVLHAKKNVYFLLTLKILFAFTHSRFSLKVAVKHLWTKL